MSTRADRLEVDRDMLEAAIADADAKELPALVREHRIILAELESLATPEKGSIRDQLSEKRAARKASAEDPASPPVRRRGGRT